MNQITKKTTSGLSKYTKFEDVYMTILPIISFRKSDIHYETYCNFCFWDVRPKNNLLISNFIIFESLLSKGIHVNVFKLCILTNFEVVFLVI